MKYYCANLNLIHRNCIVAGGGEVGARKAKGFLRCGGSVRVISPELSPELRTLADRNQIAHVPRTIRPEDLDDAFLVAAATNSPEINRKIAQWAGERRILCNVVDQPELSSFVVPAVADLGDLVIAVSTSGLSPALAKRLRQRFERDFSKDYGVLLRILGAVRKELQRRGNESRKNKEVLEAIVDSPVLDWIASGDQTALEHYLSGVLGESINLSQLRIVLTRKESSS